MMKCLLGVAIAAIAVIACSSSDDSGSSPPTCDYVGTYTMQATGEVSSANCVADDPDAGAAQNSKPTTTITISGPDDTGKVYAVQLEGVTGGCRGDVVAGCKLQTQCPITLTDAIDPNNNTGTYQFSWTFTSAGFTGTETLSFPPAKGYSHGCRGDADVTATRR